LENPHIPYEVLYVKGDEPEYSETIKELATGKHFYNMDLDTIEERIWNGYYSEAKQFMKDIRMIVKDAITSGDRERILKANEMLTNAQFGIDDFNNAEFARACKQLREREVQKQEKLLADYHKAKKEFEQRQQELLSNIEVTSPQGVDDCSPKLNDPNGVADIEMNGHSDHISGSGTAPGIGSEPSDVETNAEVGDAPSDLQENPSLSESLFGPRVESVQTQETHTPFETSKANGSMAVTPTRPGSTLPRTEAETDTGEIIADPMEESQSDSESEVSSYVDKNRELVLTHDIDILFGEKMVSATHGYTIEKLEHFVARLMEIIWEDRSQWDKTSTIDKLKTVTEGLSI
ncbi:hypothetical protein OXX69_002330, partial [Metschnikowia pulcherrima]